MSGLKLPNGLDGLTPDWMTSALREGGAIRNATVTSLQPKVIGAGAGFMGELAQVTLAYDQAEEGAPQSLIVKLPASNPQNREIATMLRFYEREVHFYDEIAEEIELRTPRRYYGAFDPESKGYVLLLEDLAPARVGNQLAGCSVDQAALALRELAKFHAAWWESPRLDEIDWMPLTSDAMIAETVEASYQQAWEPFTQVVAGKMPEPMIEIGARFASHVNDIMQYFGQRPRTIIHGDYRLDTLFFATPEGGDPLAVIDWQIASRGRGVFDVAYFLCGTLSPEDRKAKERELLKTYHDILVERGVTGYSFDECWTDYRAGSLFCFVYAVIGLGTLDLANRRGVALFIAIMKRSAAAILDNNAAELMPS